MIQNNNDSKTLIHALKTVFVNDSYVDYFRMLVEQ